MSCKPCHNLCYLLYPCKCTYFFDLIQIIQLSNKSSLILHMKCKVAMHSRGPKVIQWPMVDTIKVSRLFVYLLIWLQHTVYNYSTYVAMSEFPLYHLFPQHVCDVSTTPIYFPGSDRYSLPPVSSLLGGQYSTYGPMGYSHGDRSTFSLAT